MKMKVKKAAYKVTGTILVKVSRGIGLMAHQLEKADEAVSSVGMEMLDVANGAADDGV
tara:strand:+ start:223 stop:396 length:174 start_codon:yes stop_codon:yes gene_type:complete